MTIDFDKFPYKDMRDGQREVLNKLNDNWNKYRYFVLELPTGFGKSALAKTICASHKNAFLITATKQLQDQYTHDFHTPDVRSIKGKANYTCTYNEKLNCEIGPCMVNKGMLKDCMKGSICPYYIARDRALKANTALTSYQYFLRAMDCAGFWQPRDVLILDECHLLEQQITQWASFTLLPRELNEKFDLFKEVDVDKFIYLSAPPDESGWEKNKLFISYIYELVKLRREKLFLELETSLGGKKPEELTEDELDELSVTHKDYYEIDKLYKRIHVFYAAKDKDSWIVEPHEDGLLLTPVNVGNLFRFYMDLWGKEKIIFMSATVLDLPGFCKELGLPKEETALIRMEPEFPPEKSPIIYKPVGSMNFKNIDTSIPKIIEEVKQILKNHPKEKGIIHTGNYKIAKAICDNIMDPRLIMKIGDESNEALLKRHIKMKTPTVLVSPSLTTGADLKDELSRWQVIVKLPWPSLADKRVQKKIEFNNDWYAAEMFRTLVQASGRSTRSEDDWSTTYVLDNSFYYWIVKYRNWFSKQFLQRIKWK